MLVTLFSLPSVYFLSFSIVFLLALNDTGEMPKIYVRLFLHASGAIAASFPYNQVPYFFFSPTSGKLHPQSHQLAVKTTFFKFGTTPTISKKFENDNQQSSF